MLARIVAEFGHSLPSLAWMDEKTKQKARKKLDALGHKIGFPEISQDIKRLEEYYSKVNIKKIITTGYSLLQGSVNKIFHYFKRTNFKLRQNTSVVVF